MRKTHNIAEALRPLAPLMLLFWIQITAYMKTIKSICILPETEFNTRLCTYKAKV